MQRTLGQKPLEKVFSYCNLLVLGIAALSCFFPLWYTFCMSISSKQAVDAGWVTIWPIDLNLKNYAAIMGDRTFYSAFFRSVLRVAIGTPFTVLVSVLIAYPLSKNKRTFRLRGPIMWVLVFCMLFGGGLVPWYIFMVGYGMTNSLIGLILCGGLPIYYCILMMNSFRALPATLEEAAIVDGANPWRILFSVVAPCSLPTIATITLFVAVNYWNDYFQGMVLSKKDIYYPLMTYIRSFTVTVNMSGGDTEQLIRATQMSNKALNAAKVFVALLPMLVVYPFVQRFFIRGIMIGSVKE